MSLLNVTRRITEGPYTSNSQNLEISEVGLLQWFVGASILVHTLFSAYYGLEWLFFGPSQMLETGPGFARAVQVTILIWLWLAISLLSLYRYPSNKTMMVIVWTYLIGILAIIQFNSLGVRSTLFNLVYVAIILAGFLLGLRQMFFMAGLAILANLFLYYQEQQNGLVPTGTAADFGDVLSIVFPILMITAVVWRIQLALTRRSDEIKKYQSQLEQLVQQKTADLRLALTEAEKANQAKSTFLATMSHELRTPLNAIIGYSEMALEDIEDIGFQDEHLEDITRVRDSGRHLLHLINMVLDLSKVEAGEEETTIRPLMVQPLVHEAIQFCEPMIRKSGSRVETKIDFPSPGLVLADHKKLLQVLINVIGNAAKFTEHGLITVSVSSEENGSMMLFEVRDTGIGLPINGIENLFEPFAQEEGAYNRKYAGTGLGLAISKRFCEMMDGQISAHNHPDGGAVFQICIPTAP